MGFEGPPGKPEVTVRRCPNCGGKGTVKDSSGKSKTCTRCNGSGQIRSNA